MPETIKSVEGWINHGAAYFEREQVFFGHGTDNALDEAGVLVAWVLGLEWDALKAALTEKVGEQDSQAIQALFSRRVEQRVPAAYLTGEAWFAGRKYKVSSDVLVPRSPIAELILGGFRPWVAREPESILDLCCGSGCIGLACAHEFNTAVVTVSDISAKAIGVALANIAEHKLESRVTAIESDGFNNIEQKFDLIVSNPPYVDAQDLAAMPAEYQAEPQIGLASGEDGLDFTRMLLKQAANYLNENGSLIVEVGNSAEALERLLPKVPFMWPEFEYGGHGVFVLSQKDLRENQAVLNAL